MLAAAHGQFAGGDAGCSPCANTDAVIVIIRADIGVGIIGGVGGINGADQIVRGLYGDVVIAVCQIGEEVFAAGVGRNSIQQSCTVTGVKLYGHAAKRGICPAVVCAVGVIVSIDEVANFRFVESEIYGEIRTSVRLLAIFTRPIGKIIVIRRLGIASGAYCDRGGKDCPAECAAGGIQRAVIVRIHVAIGVRGSCFAESSVIIAHGLGGVVAFQDRATAEIARRDNHDIIPCFEVIEEIVAVGIGGIRSKRGSCRMTIAVCNI